VNFTCVEGTCTCEGFQQIDSTETGLIIAIFVTIPSVGVVIIITAIVLRTQYTRSLKDPQFPPRTTRRKRRMNFTNKGKQA
jgi:hypothetical protein